MRVRLNRIITDPSVVDLALSPRELADLILLVQFRNKEVLDALGVNDAFCQHLYDTLRKAESELNVE